MVEPKASMSFEKRRRAMLEQVSANTKHASIKKEVPFLNEDVPKFISSFNEFEKESQRVHFIVK